MIKTHSHSLITLGLMALAFALGTHVFVSLLIVGFWLGREHSQAEYRYMKLKGINRSQLGFFDGFKKEAWNLESFINDFFIPLLIAVLIGFLLPVYL